MTPDPTLLKFIAIGVASEPEYDEDAFANYHPPTNPDDRRDYLTESVLAKDDDGNWYVKLILTGRWHQEAMEITSGLRFFVEDLETLVANNIEQDEIFAGDWDLKEYRLKLPTDNDPEGTVMTGELTWTKEDGERKTSWIWIERL